MLPQKAIAAVEALKGERGGPFHRIQDWALLICVAHIDSVSNDADPCY